MYTQYNYIGRTLVQLDIGSTHSITRYRAYTSATRHMEYTQCN